MFRISYFERKIFKWFENLKDFKKYKDFYEDWVAKRLFPNSHTNLIIPFNFNNTSLNDILTKIGTVAYFKLLFLFLEKQFHVMDCCNSEQYN